mgnify:FL=1
MPNRSKQKGTRYESELVEQALAAGLKARRAWGSNGASIGHHPEVDLVVDGYKMQAKRRKSLPNWAAPSEHVDVQVFRQDRGESFVMLSWWDLLQLLKQTHACHEDSPGSLE